MSALATVLWEKLEDVSISLILLLALLKLTSRAFNCVLLLSFSAPHPPWKTRLWGSRLWTCKDDWLKFPISGPNVTFKASLKLNHHCHDGSMYVNLLKLRLRWRPLEPCRPPWETLFLTQMLSIWLNLQGYVSKCFRCVTAKIYEVQLKWPFHTGYTHIYGRSQDYKVLDRLLK